MTAAETLRAMRVKFDGLDVSVNQDGALVLSAAQADALIDWMWIREGLSCCTKPFCAEREAHAAFEAALKETR